MRVVRPAPDVTRGYIPMEGESVAGVVAHMPLET